MTLNPKAEFPKELGTSSSQGSTSMSPAPHSLDPGSICLTLHWFKKQKQKNYQLIRRLVRVFLVKSGWIHYSSTFSRDFFLSLV